MTMNQSSKDETWLHSLEAALPPGEDCSIIVASRSGTQYLTLNSESIAAHVTAIKQRQRRWFQGLAAVAVAFTSILAVVYVNALQLTGALEQKTAALASLTEKVEGIRQSVPSVAWEAAGDDIDDVHQLLTATQRSLVAYRDLMDFYVEITRDLLQEQTESVKAALVEVGVDTPLPQAIPSDTVAIGGIRDDSIMTALLDLHVNNDVADLLDLAQTQQLVLQGLPTAMPVEDVRMTSRFGMRRHPVRGGHQMHRGIDLTTSGNRDIRPAADGEVAAVGRNTAYGKYLTVQHTHGVRTLYAHLDQILVTEGDTVTRDTIIGVMGNTGRSTATHLHFEVHANGKRIDPLRFMELAQYVR
jgi:murein DD-endopeptidase MepM/ murein hydrolase activator NlpD